MAKKENIGGKAAKELGYGISEAVEYNGELYFFVCKGFSSGHYGLPVFIKVSQGTAQVIMGIDALDLCNAIVSF